MSRVIVAGALANKSRQGGEAWVRLAWALGLRELGCEVHFAEELAPGVDTTEGVAYFETIAAEFQLPATLLGVHDPRKLVEFAASADLLVNISGHLTHAPVFERVACRAYVDVDPGHTQFWHASGSEGARLAGHDVFFSVGENIGAPGCTIPDCGIHWNAIRPPVVLSQWPARERVAPRFTTIANWRSGFGGSGYSQKAHEFRKVLDLPRRTGAQFELALNIHPGDARDLAALREHGWKIVDPVAAAGTPEQFRQYLANSGAEFSCAQGIYTETHSGWFSDRTAHYLACGRPTLVQATGNALPSGEGLLTFSTADEAANGVASILANLPRHSRAARALAEEYFDSRKVLTRFLEIATHPTHAH